MQRISVFKRCKLKLIMNASNDWEIRLKNKQI